jgi:hypothetical protein
MKWLGSAANRKNALRGLIFFFFFFFFFVGSNNQCPLTEIFSQK